MESTLINMRSKHIVSILAARVLKTANIEYRKPSSAVHTVMATMDLSANAVKNTVSVPKTTHTNPPTRRCDGAPGVSEIPTTSAPKEISVPVVNSPKKAQIITGTIHPNVMRSPSSKYWLKKKLLISCDLF